MTIQVFRLMGLPDKIIAFDELPEDLVKGFELCRADAFPKYWKNWMGTKKIVTSITPELNPVTGQRRTFSPIIEEDSYFYLVDWTLKPSVEQWRKIEEYVRRKVSSDFRLTDKLEDMAKPLAANKVDGITLEPDDVVVIPVPKEIISSEDKESVVYTKRNNLGDKKKSKREITIEKCDVGDCKAEFKGAYSYASIRMHKLKKHPSFMAPKNVDQPIDKPVEQVAQVGG